MHPTVIAIEDVTTLTKKKTVLQTHLKASHRFQWHDPYCFTARPVDGIQAPEYVGSQLFLSFHVSAKHTGLPYRQVARFHKKTK